MWNLWQWAVASNDRAVANAREAAVDCSRRCVESAEVQVYLERLTAHVSVVDESLRSVSHR